MTIFLTVRQKISARSDVRQKDCVNLNIAHTRQYFLQLLILSNYLTNLLIVYGPLNAAEMDDISFAQSELRATLSARMLMKPYPSPPIGRIGFH